jgi:hypothetical protein
MFENAMHVACAVFCQGSSLDSHGIHGRSFLLAAEVSPILIPTTKRLTHCSDFLPSERPLGDYVGKHSLHILILLLPAYN